MVLLAAARVPGVGAALSENVLGAFSTVLEQLDRAGPSQSPGASAQSATAAAQSSGDGQQNARQAQRLALDASTLCALMPAAAAAAAMANGDGGAGERAGPATSGLILRAGEAVVQAAGAMAAAGLQGRGPEFAALQVG